MFKKETYIQRREALKKAVGTGLLLFMGNDEAGCNFEDNLYPYRQDSTFLYYFGLPYAGLMAVIDIDENREIIFGDELTIDAIVWRTRLPRIIGSMAVGAILGVSGVVMQAIVRNPLAEPYVLGVSSGASTGAAFAMITLGVSSGGLVGLLAFGGASLATAAVLAVAGRTHSPLHLVLGGLAVGFGFQAVTNLIIFSADSAEAGQSVSFWMLGSMARIGVGDLPRLVVTAGLLAIAMAVLGPVLDALASGDRTAQSVGVEPGRARIWLLLPVSAAVAIAVASAGGIGFIGLIIPHIMRSFIGHSHRLLVVGTALAAALFCVWTDTAARIVFSPTELPLGVITGLVGAPFLVLIIRRSRTAW